MTACSGSAALLRYPLSAEDSGAVATRIGRTSHVSLFIDQFLSWRDVRLSPCVREVGPIQRLTRRLAMDPSLHRHGQVLARGRTLALVDDQEESPGSLVLRAAAPDCTLLARLHPSWCALGPEWLAQTRMRCAASHRDCHPSVAPVRACVPSGA